jgi:ubiquinol-cytochrome c reductase iron-sulfur subunit
MNPDASTIAAGAPVEVDLGPSPKVRSSRCSGAQADLHQPSQQEEIEEAQKVDVQDLADPQPDPRASSKAMTSGWC